MGISKILGGVFIIIASAFFSGELLAETESSENHRPIYVGVPENRYPYSYKNTENKITGLLIDKISDICEKNSFSCTFIDGDFHENLEKLQTLNIDALLVIDSIIIPDSDEVKTTLPLCKYNAVFVKKVRLSLQKKITNDDLQNKTIGVTAESALHLYALDNYYSFSSIKPYETMESGVFDIFSEKIDILFTEEAFYESRIGSTLLGNRHNGFWLKKLGSDSIDLPETLMTLVLRNNDDELWNKMASAITKQDAEQLCSALLPDVETDTEEPANDTNAIEKN